MLNNNLTSASDYNSAPASSDAPPLRPGTNIDAKCGATPAVENSVDRESAYHSALPLACRHLATLADVDQLLVRLLLDQSPVNSSVVRHFDRARQ